MSNWSEDFTALIEHNLSLEEWISISLDDEATDRVKDALFKGLSSGRESFPLLAAMERNLGTAVRRFATEIAHSRDLTILGAKLMLDLEFCICIEHSFYLDVRPIPLRYLGFPILHSVRDAPDDTLLKLSVRREDLMILDRRLRDPRGGKIATVRKYWKSIARAWGSDSLPEDDIMNEFIRRRMNGFIMFSDGGRDRVHPETLDILWSGGRVEKHHDNPL